LIGIAKTLFFDRSFLGHSLSFAGVLGVVCSQTSGFLYPLAGIKIAAAQSPKRGARMLPQMSHEARVPDSPTFNKWNNVDCLAAKSGENAVKCAADRYRYTTRQDLASVKWTSPTRVPQIDRSGGLL
jgi:hypothetical protein